MSLTAQTIHEHRPRGGSDACEHQWVFSGAHFVTHNPSWDAVCSTCGRRAELTFSSSAVKPPIDRELFVQLLRHWQHDLAGYESQAPASDAAEHQ